MRLAIDCSKQFQYQRPQSRVSYLSYLLYANVFEVMSTAGSQREKIIGVMETRSA